MRLLIYVFLSIATLNGYASCQNDLFTFKVNSSKKSSATILNVLENLNQTCKLSIVFSDDKTKELVNKKISYLNVKDVPLESLLNLLLTQNNLFYTLEDNILKISYLQTKSFYIDYINFSKVTNSSSKTISTGSSGSKNGGGGLGGKGSTDIKFDTEFGFWENIQKEIDSILVRSTDSQTTAKTIVNKEAGLLTVTGTKQQIDRVSKYIKKLTSRLHKQVLIEAKIIEVTYDNDHTTGINWSQLQASLNGHVSGVDKTLIHTLGHPTSILGYNLDMEGLLRFLKTQGEVSIVSNPKVLTLNNQPAVINVGEEKNYKYTLGTSTTTTNGVVQSDPQYEVGTTFVGVTLGIVPEVTQDDNIILKINPSVSEISKNHLDKNGVPNLAPDIKVKQLSSIVKVKNNQQIIIGGLVQKRSENRVTKVPVLGNIPILGNAFKSNNIVKTKSELIIVMRPKLISGDFSSPSLGELENGYANQ